MKKLLIGILISTSLIMSACGIKLNEITINDTDSELLKDYKTLYNLDLKSYNQNDLQEKLMETWECEAKAHPKDSMGIILVRAIVNYVDFSNEKQSNFSDKELMQNVLNNLLEENKELKKCDESESKNSKKIPNEKLEESRKIEQDAHSIRNKSLELKDFDKVYKEIGKNALNSITRKNSLGKELTGEEFLKLNYKKLLKEAHKKQGNALNDMKKKIENMK